MEYPESSELQSEKEKTIAQFEDLRGKNLRLRYGDLRATPADALATTTFDTQTRWPKADKLPSGFNPEQVLEDGKNPGLDIRELHEQGITGKGVRVAIIDQKLLLDHEEYKDKLVNYTEYGNKENKPSMHGPAVASLLVGEKCGVAPGAELVYGAVPSGGNLSDKAVALNGIIEYNRTCEPDKKIRVVSISKGYSLNDPEPGQDEWMGAIQKATDEGIIVIDVSIGNRQSLNFTGGGNLGDKNNPDSYEPWLAGQKKKGIDEELERLIDEENMDGAVKKIRELAIEMKREDIQNLSDAELRKMIEKMQQVRKDQETREKREILIPSDHRTLASPKGGSEYTYQGKGGLSWSTPYLAGLFVLALQVNPDLKQEEIIDIIQETALTNKKGLRIINPKGIIETVQERVEK